MKALRVALFVCLVATCAAPHAEKTEGARGTAFGADHAFSMKAPAGWIVDTESGASAGVGLVFYPAGRTWRDSEVVLYVRGRPKDDEVRSIDHQVEYTVKDFRSNGSPNYKIDSSVERTLPNTRTAKVVFYSGEVTLPRTSRGHVKRQSHALSGTFHLRRLI
jgi:hypothetical protein